MIHVGRDFPNEVFETPQDYADALIMPFDRDHDVDAQAFFTPNPKSPGTGVTYLIGNMIHGYDSGNAVKGIVSAVDAMEDVVAQMRLAQKDAVIGRVIGGLTDDQVQGWVSEIETRLHE